MRLRGLLIAASMAVVWPLPVPAAGCQYDMQCKGERICQQGQCVYPSADADDQADAAAAKAAAPAPVPAATPASRPPPPPQQRCCTVAGKLKLAPPHAGEPALMLGDMCQGLMASGRPVPGTVCN